MNYLKSIYLLTFKSQPTPQGFMLVGGNGFIAIYERVEDKKDRYVETKRLALGALRLQYAAVFPSEVMCAGVKRVVGRLGASVCVRADGRVGMGACVGGWACVGG
jgi:hypothetical protein